MVCCPTKMQASAICPKNRPLSATCTNCMRSVLHPQDGCIKKQKCQLLLWVLHKSLTQRGTPLL